ncbi:MAG: APC family permease [Gammaproteobacteria bacterium]|nr:APC family permease [Gammaproteobacteria bacterium]MDH3858306.1 APC family permease [Gammaproteobacteria bacterium]
MQKPATPQDLNGLERSVSLFQATVYGVGIILGAGIYALIGEAAGIAGNAIWISFVIAALIAACSAISYAELSALYPKSAAEFVYVKEITGSPFLGFVVGYVTVVTGIIGAAAVSLGFASYFKLYVDTDPVIVGIALILVVAVLNFRGIQLSARVNMLLTFAEVGGLLFIIFIGIPYLGEVNLITVDPVSTTGNASGWKPMLAAAALVFFAYQGFEDIANIAEETKAAETTVPLALLLSLLITTVVYILVAMVAVSVVSADALFSASKLDNPSEGPLALVASTALNSPVGGKLFTVIALCATANTVLVLHIVTSRMLFGIARENCLPDFLARINPKTKTPVGAVVLATIFCILFTLGGSLGEVANLTNVGVFLVFLMVNLMLLMHRYKNRESETLRRTSLSLALNLGWFPLLPLLGALFCAAMLLTQFWQPMMVLGISVPIIIYALLITVLAVPIYMLSRRNWN